MQLSIQRHRKAFVREYKARNSDLDLIGNARDTVGLGFQKIHVIKDRTKNLYMNQVSIGAKILGVIPVLWGLPCGKFELLEDGHRIGELQGKLKDYSHNALISGSEYTLNHCPQGKVSLWKDGRQIALIEFGKDNICRANYDTFNSENIEILFVLCIFSDASFMRNTDSHIGTISFSNIHQQDLHWHPQDIG